MLKEVTKVRRNFCPLHTWMTITLTFCLQLEWKSEPFCNATMEESFPYHSNHSIICHAFRHSLLQDYKCKCLWHKFIATEKTPMYSNLISVFFFWFVTLKFKTHGNYWDVHQLEKAVIRSARSVLIIWMHFSFWLRKMRKYFCSNGDLFPGILLIFQSLRITANDGDIQAITF